MESIGKNFTPQNSSATIRGRVKHKDGHYIWVESRVRAIFDEKTLELSEYYAVTRDITDRKKAEQEIAESEDRYRTLVEISPDAVVIQQQGKFIFVNPAALKLYGALHPAELIGKNVIDFIQPEFRMGVRKNIEKDLNGEITPPMELHILRIDGTAVFVECRGVKTSINGEPAIQIRSTRYYRAKTFNKCIAGERGDCTCTH